MSKPTFDNDAIAELYKAFVNGEIDSDTFLKVNGIIERSAPVKIIKRGDPKRITKKFICTYCGCEFAADERAYTYSGACHSKTQKWATVYSCDCPECGRKAEYEVNQ